MEENINIPRGHARKMSLGEKVLIKTKESSYEFEVDAIIGIDDNTCKLNLSRCPR